MINSLLTGVLGFMNSLTTAILTPITTAITAVLGNNATAFLQPVADLGNYLKQFVPLGVSYLGLTSEMFALLLSIFVLTITIPIGVHLIKLAIKWYNALKL